MASIRSKISAGSWGCRAAARSSSNCGRQEAPITADATKGWPRTNLQIMRPERAQELVFVFKEV